MRAITAQDMQDIRAYFPLEACLPPPDLSVPAEAAQAFDRLFDQARRDGPAQGIDYRLPYPKYLFLEYLAAKHGLMLHGSNNRAIDVLRPIRFSTDSGEFGNQNAVYASQDPLWAMYFAVLDKNGLKNTGNGAIHLKDEAGGLLRRYYFTIDIDHLRRKPWTAGAMYLLPGQGFEPDPEMLGVKVGPYTMQVTHWIHRGEVTPIARLDVEPQDFPFLERIWGCDLAEFSRRMDAASLAGFPFLKDPQVYPVMPQGGG